MECFIYRCSLKPDMYIYLAEEDVFDNVPKEIFDSLKKTRVQNQPMRISRDRGPGGAKRPMTNRERFEAGC